MGLPLQTVSYYNNSSGVDLKRSDTKVAEEKASSCLNMDYTTDGAFRTRFGSSIKNVGNQMAGAPKTLLMHDYRKSDGTSTAIIAAGTDIFHSLTNPVSQGFALDAGLPYPDIEDFVTNDDEYAFYGNGVDTNLKWNGVAWTNWSLARPAAPVPVEVNLGGGGLANGLYEYHVSFARTVAGIIVQESELSLIGSVTVAAGPSDVSVGIAVSADAQVNARVIYRKSPTSGGVFFRLTTVLNNADVAFVDVVPTDGTIEAEFDNQAAPTTAIFENYGNRMVMVDAAQPTDYVISKAGKPWNVPTANRVLLDGPIQCMEQAYDTLIIGTDRSLWVVNGDPATVDPKKFSSKIGILNNRCAVGEASLYIISTTKKMYAIRPTDFSQDEMRLDAPISDDVDPEFKRIGNSLSDQVAMEYYTQTDNAKVAITYPVGSSTNNNMLIYNEEQSLRARDTVWQPWNNIEASALRQFVVGDGIELVSGDFNGFIWEIDDQNTDGDGAEVNGTATSSTNNTLTDTSLLIDSGTATAGGAATLTDAGKAFVVNDFVNDQLYINAGTGAGQVRTIASNTPTVITVTVPWGVVPDNTSQYMVGGLTVNAHIGKKILITDGTGIDEARKITANVPDTVTVSVAWNDNPDATSKFAIGGYDKFHFTNWKEVLSSYDFIKQLWYIYINANASGNYNINMILQFNFDTTQANQTNLLINLSALNSIWGLFLWLGGVWGSRSVFQDQFRAFKRYHSMRVKFQNKDAGRPFQINGFSIVSQDKKLLFKGAS